MYPEALVALLTSPLALVTVLAVVYVSARLSERQLSMGLSRVSFIILVRGYLVVIGLAMALGFLIDSDAPDNSRVGMVFLGYSSVLVLAIVVVPVIALLASIGRDTIPHSLGVIFGVAVLATGCYHISWSASSGSMNWASFASTFGLICGFLVVVTLAFGVTVRLPWGRSGF